MAAIGEIVTQSQLASLKKYSEESFTKRGYVAPTVFRLANASVATWPYYATLAEAVNQYKFLAGLSKTASKPKGSIAFANNGKAQTMGINVDMFTFVPYFGTTVVPYSWVKKEFTKPGRFIAPFRFTKPDGSGPYFSIFVSDFFSMAATVVSNIATDKLAALDKFHREVQLLKAKYNTLTLYLNDLSKKTLKPAQQRSFNEALLLKNTLESQIRTIKGLDVTYSNTGQIGVIDWAIIIIIAIIAAAATWTVTTITAEASKVAKINAANDIVKFIANQKLQIAKDLKAGLITLADADAMVKSLDGSLANAEKVISVNSGNQPGVLDKMQNLLLIGGGIFLVSKFIK